MLPRRAAILGCMIAGAVLAGAGTAQAALDPTALRRVTDQYLHHTSLSAFQSTRAARPHAGQLDWASDGCSNSPDNPLGFDFVRACYRHDFGYRNYKSQHRFTEPNRLALDNRFKSDMYELCTGNWICNRTADIYYAAVREFGGRTASTAETLNRPEVRAAARAAGS